MHLQSVGNAFIPSSTTLQGENPSEPVQKPVQIHPSPKSTVMEFMLMSRLLHAIQVANARAEGMSFSEDLFSPSELIMMAASQN